MVEQEIQDIKQSLADLQERFPPEEEGRMIAEGDVPVRWVPKHHPGYGAQVQKIMEPRYLMRAPNEWYDGFRKDDDSMTTPGTSND